MKKRTPDTQLDQVLKTLDRDFNYSGIESDYDTDYSDDHNDDCSYCSCKLIINFKIKSVDFKCISKNICDGIKNPITQYCVDRLLVINQLYDKDNWEGNVHKGYYGEEVDIQINPSIITKLKEQIGCLWHIPDADKIRYVLNAEYGFVLDRLEPATNASIKTVSVQDIMIPNQDYSRKLSPQSVEIYNDYNMPIGIFSVEDSGKYRLIDGYHRTMAVVKNKKNVDIVVLE